MKYCLHNRKVPEAGYSGLGCVKFSLIKSNQNQKRNNYQTVILTFYLFPCSNLIIIP